MTDQDQAGKVFGAADEFTPGDVGSSPSKLLHWYKLTLFEAIGRDPRMAQEIRLAQETTGMAPWMSPKLESTLDRNARIFQMLVEGLGIDMNMALEYSLDLLRKDTVNAMIGESAKGD